MTLVWQRIVYTLVLGMLGALPFSADVLYKNGNFERKGKGTIDVTNQNIIHFKGCDGEDPADYDQRKGYRVQKLDNCHVHKKGKKRSKKM
jgi:hypothetical protein